ncbi:bifunctional hydroxymethylpyrimidine kinase/phosphomethylpyrimidine kinase [Alkalibacterium sp.]|nr:MAG: bifunctional hydroxymethylpyrimidine kinase/phosphomethylpyrimidine kinase [Alkalibacterium sp.]
MTQIPQVLTIAGSDSGGGAGIQADLKTFQERDVFGLSVITAVTAQNTLGVQAVHPVPLDSVRNQWDSIFTDFNVSAIKTGMLVNGDYMELMSEVYSGFTAIPLVIDPVMIAKGGHSLMEETAIQVMKDKLAPLAHVITPNIPEAEALTGIAIESKADMLEAAKNLQANGSRNVVIKGGHALDKDKAEDLLLLENGERVWLSTERIDTKDTHGTGCTFSACIAAELGKGQTVEQAVRTAKAYIQAAIKNGLDIGHGHGPTNHWAYRKEVQ